MLVSVSFIAIAISTRPAKADPAEAARKVRTVVAHRGASAERPENTLAALRRAVEVGATAVEVDVRTSKDGRLFLLHDATLDRTTDGEGPAKNMTLAELKRLDAGSWMDAKFKGERIPTLAEAAALSRGKTVLMLDLKEFGPNYAEAVAGAVRRHGEPRRTIIGARSVEQARRFRKLLPESPQMGLVPSPRWIKPFIAAGVETIRLRMAWFKDQPLAVEVHQQGVRVHLGGSTGTLAETLPLLAYQPDSLSADDPARLLATLEKLRQSNDGRERD